MVWKTLLMGGENLPLWGFAVRAVLLYLSLILVTRWMGFRQIGILAGHNYLVAAGIVSLAAVRMVNPEASFLSALLIVFVYAGANILLSYIDLKWPKLIDRHGVVLVHNGVINRKNMLGSHVTIDNLLGQLRLKGAPTLSEVAYAVLEPIGKINVIKKAANLPVNRKNMNLPPKTVGLPTILIYDGKIEQQNLYGRGLDEKWLEAELKKHGVIRFQDVFLAALEPDGTLYLSL